MCCSDSRPWTLVWVSVHLSSMDKQVLGWQHHKDMFLWAGSPEYFIKAQEPQGGSLSFRFEGEVKGSSNTQLWDLAGWPCYSHQYPEAL